MRLLGFEITKAKTLFPVADNRGGWFPLINESFSGAWQRNVEVNQNLITSYHAVFACITLIASDISKLRVKFMRLKDGVGQEGTSPAYDPVLRNPNRMQNRIQFWENWILSKLIYGNTYVLKERDARNVITRLYILDPNRVKVLVTDGGDAFYDLQNDNITGLKSPNITVPASDIIHDRMNCLHHTLVGISPLYAAGLAATQGLAIQNSSTRFFGNRSIPGGVLTAPTTISDLQAARLKEGWDKNFSGDGAGKIAVLGDGLKFEAMAVKATDAQMLEQAKATAEWVCSAFRVPPYKIGIPPTPAYANIQALNILYYEQCLQSLLEAAEECLLNGLEMKSGTWVQFDIDNLFRMDTVSQVASIKEAVGAGVMAPNEGRAKLDLPPVTGGDSPYLQQQNYSLSALDKRDRDEPFAKPAPTPPPVSTDQPSPEDMAASRAFRAGQALAKELGLDLAA